MDMTSMTEMYIIQKLEIPFGVDTGSFNSSSSPCTT